MDSSSYLKQTPHSDPGDLDVSCLSDRPTVPCRILSQAPHLGLRTVTLS
jgi:hypothetical protein